MVMVIVMAIAAHGDSDGDGDCDGDGDSQFEWYLSAGLGLLSAYDGQKEHIEYLDSKLSVAIE